MRVVPRGVVARRHFAAGAIGLALFIYGRLAQSAAEAAVRVGCWGRGASAWRTLRRWVGAIDDGRLFRGVRASPPGWRPRQRAERAAMTLASLVPATASDLGDKVFAGAALAA